MDWIQRWRRSRALRRAHLPPEVRHWLEAPWPQGKLSWRDVEFTTIDLETSGLDTRNDCILAIGTINIVGGRVRVGSAWQTLVRPPDNHIISVESIRIHGLLPERVATAPPLAEVLPRLLERLAGRVLVVHVAAVDGPFLERALKEHYGCGLLMPILDTARIAESLEDRYHLIYPDHHAIVSGPRRLATLARDANIPVERQHDALADAFTTAQLFLSQCRALEAFRLTTLTDLRRVGS